MKLIIDIEPRYCKDMQSDVKGLYYEAINRITEAVRNGQPYEEKLQGDSISRDALKKAIMNDLGLGDEENGSDAEYMSGLQDCYNLIDNAPAVADRTEEVLSLQNTIAKLVDGIAENARPTGEWIKNEHTFWTCSHCNWFNEMNRIKYNFCPCCGATMQKGGAE